MNSMDHEHGQNELAAAFQALHENEELLARVIDYFPYPVEVFAPDGTTVMVNKAVLDEYHISDPGMIVGRYNIFEAVFIF